LRPLDDCFRVIPLVVPYVINHSLLVRIFKNFKNFNKNFKSIKKEDDFEKV